VCTLPVGDYHAREPNDDFRWLGLAYGISSLLQPSKLCPQLSGTTTAEVATVGFSLQIGQ
jgi:hypothetical protein